MHQLTDVLLFIEIANQGSIAGAARMIGVTRATAARRLAALEDHLGVQLVLRNTRSLSLTHAGQIYLKHAKNIRDSVEKAEYAVTQMKESPHGHIRLAAPIINTERILIPLVKSFTERYPDITIEVVFATDVRNLVAESFDLGLQTGLEKNASLIMRTLIRDRLQLAASPKYIEQYGPIHSVDDLKNHHCLTNRTADGMREDWPLTNGRKLHIERPKLVTNSHELLQAVAVEGIGIYLGSAIMMHKDLESGRLVQVLPDEVYRNEFFSLVYPATRWISPQLRVLIDFIIDWVGAFKAINTVFPNHNLGIENL